MEARKGKRERAELRRDRTGIMRGCPAGPVLTDTYLPSCPLGQCAAGIRDISEGMGRTPCSVGPVLVAGHRQKTVNVLN